MAKAEVSDQFPPEEAAGRLRKALKGAFAGPPTQMKAIGKKLGKAQRSEVRRKAKTTRAFAKAGR